MTSITVLKGLQGKLLAERSAVCAELVNSAADKNLTSQMRERDDYYCRGQIKGLDTALKFIKEMLAEAEVDDDTFDKACNGEI